MPCLEITEVHTSCMPTTELISFTAVANYFGFINMVFTRTEIENMSIDGTVAELSKGHNRFLVKFPEITFWHLLCCFVM